MRILLALDGSPSADRARALVTSLAWPVGSIVRVVAALDVSPALWGGPWIPAVPVDADQLEAEAVRELTRVVQEARDALGAAGLRWRPSCSAAGPRRPSSRTPGCGSPTSSSSAVAAMARSRRLSWAPSRRRSWTTPSARSSSPAAITSRGWCWRRTARPPAWRLAMSSRPGRRSPPSRCSSWGSWTSPLRGARASRQRCSGRPWTSTRTCSPPPGRRTATSCAATEAHLRAAGRTATGELREGDPADQLRRAATDPAGDLIVVGSRGYVGVTRIVMGSVAHAVLTHAHCSVLVIKQPHDGH